MNLALKFALLERGIPAYRTAIEANLHPNKLSKFITGLQEPTEEEKQRIAGILQRPVADLFPSQNPPGPA